MITTWEERAKQLSSEMDLLFNLVLAFPDTEDPDVAIHTKALLRGLRKYIYFVLEKAKLAELVKANVCQLMLGM
jgi:hypothetical protein